MVVRIVALCDMNVRAHNWCTQFELFSLFKVVLTRVCCFCCYKLCSATKACVERVTSSDIARIEFKVDYVQCTFRVKLVSNMLGML